MCRPQQRYLLLLLLAVCQILQAQRVLYSPALKGTLILHFTVAGKTGDNYWIHKEQRKRRIPRQGAGWMKEEEFFDIYDSRLELLNSVAAAAVNASTLKKYLVSGDRFFDELILSAAQQQTDVQLRRYAADGRLLADSIVANFPFNETGNSFILTVSADKTKILLLGFEPVPASAPKLHAIIFDDNWKKISSHVYIQPFITQPLIQDDFFCFPSAANNAPVQLANNGEWLMAAPSRTSNNFLLLHFDGQTANMSYKEIILPSLYKMEDIALSVNNEKGEAFAGILSAYRQTANKNVHVTHYSFSGDAFDFDSSYRFSTLAGTRAKENNLVRENFIAVPDMGFILLKEYGRTFNGWYQNNNNDRLPDAELLLTGNPAANTPARFPFNANGYSRFSNSGAARDNHSRGDLSLFYFPGRPSDSCWSGFINKKQITELNAPTLSYLFVPLPDKLVLMYNSVEREEFPYGSTLALDAQGNQVDERELISWKSDQSLLFQQALQITKNEVAVPYERTQQKGFAIIRF